MLISSYVMEFLVNLYARDYGGFGVVLAIYFWVLFSSGIIVWAASLSPALAERRKLGRRPSTQAVTRTCSTFLPALATGAIRDVPGEHLCP